MISLPQHGLGGWPHPAAFVSRPVPSPSRSPCVASKLLLASGGDVSVISPITSPTWRDLAAVAALAHLGYLRGGTRVLHS